MFRIGEFSRLVNTTTKTIRFYDKEEILLPDYVDNSSGYRYYSHYKIAEYNKIRTLKELGFSLSEIKEMKKQQGNEVIIETIRKRRKELQSELEILHNRLEEINNMENDFMNLINIYEDQSKYINKVEVDGNSLVFNFDKKGITRLEYECPDKVDLYHMIKFYLEVINNFGLVNYEKAEISKIISQGKKASIFICKKDELCLYIDKKAKSILLGFTIGMKIELIDIYKVVKDLVNEVGEDLDIYFSVVVNKEMYEKDIDTSLINIK
jgi:DNA-binding transcriptional MerR regulator